MVNILYNKCLRICIIFRVVGAMYICTQKANDIKLVRAMHHSPESFAVQYVGKARNLAHGLE